MFRELFTNNWVLCSIGFLVLLSIACVWWYYYDTAPDRIAVTEAEEYARQYFTKPKPNIKEKKHTQITETHTTEKTSGNIQEVDNLKQHNNTESDLPLAYEEVIDNIRYITVDSPNGKITYKLPNASPHGFGTFPEIPPDYNLGAVWLKTHYYQMSTEYQRNMELLDRVLIKLWSQGEKNFQGGLFSGMNGRVYPYYFDTYYITINASESVDGSIDRFEFSVRGRRPPPADIDLLNPPDHITVLDFDNAGLIHISF